MPNQPTREDAAKLFLACRIAIVLAALTLVAPGARADGPEAPMFSFSGFGSLGLVHSSEHQADFISSGLKPNGAGFSHNWSADVDSLIGAQVSANLTPELSAVLQVISEQNYDNTYRPHVEWANIKYAFTPDFSIRAGRIVLPTFLVSDYRKVGYANTWVRPPVELYSLIPINTSDGLDASFRLRAGDLTNTVQASYGSAEPRLPAGGSAKSKDARGISDTVEYGAATLHVSYFKTRLTLESLNPLFDGFRQFGPEGVTIADKYDVNNKDFTFIGLGGMYDPGGWYLIGEWGATDSHSALGKRSAWYTSGGYRLGKFTPYLIFAQAKADSNTSDPGLNVSALPAFLAGAAGALNAGLNTTLAATPVQKTVSFGGRWDFTRDVDLKLQFDHTRLGDGSPGTLINTQPGFRPGGTVNVISAVVDFVF